MEPMPTTPPPPPSPVRRTGYIVCAWWLLLIVLTGLASGCDKLLPTVPPLLSNGVRTPTAPLAVTAVVSPATTVAPSPTALAPAATPITRTGTITLVLWYPDQLAPVATSPGGAVLFEQLNSFRQMNPRVRVAGVRKKAYGPGGLLDYLRTTSRVLPGGMPDLIALDLTEVGQAAALGLIQSLDNLLPAALLADLFPVAAHATFYGEKRMALPYEIAARLLAYNRAMLSHPPATWADLLSGKSRYLLPLGDDDTRTADGLLLQYYALGGQLTDAEGRLTLDDTKLSEALAFYQETSANRVLHSAALTMTTLAECWQLYKTGGVAMTDTSTRLALAEPERLGQTRYASIPTKSGVPATLVEGWAWCLVTTTPERQQKALALLSWLMEEDNLADRAQAAYSLPARREALGASVADTELSALLEQLLEHAYLRPFSTRYAELEPLLQAALQDILLGSSTPEQATQEIMAFVERQRIP